MRAKFKVQRIEKYEAMETVHLAAVTDPANKTWAAFTPSGSIALSITNPGAIGHLAIGETYFVDFTKAPATEAGERAP